MGRKRTSEHSVGRLGARIKIGGCAFVRVSLFFPSQSILGRPGGSSVFSFLSAHHIRFCTRNHVDHSAVTGFLLAHSEYSLGICEICFNCMSRFSSVFVSYRISYLRRVRSYYNYFRGVRLPLGTIWLLHF